MSEAKKGRQPDYDVSVLVKIKLFKRGSYTAIKAPKYTGPPNPEEELDCMDTLKKTWTEEEYALSEALSQQAREQLQQEADSYWPAVVRNKVRSCRERFDEMRLAVDEPELGGDCQSMWTQTKMNIR